LCDYIPYHDPVMVKEHFIDLNIYSSEDYWRKYTQCLTYIFLFYAKTEI